MSWQTPRPDIVRQNDVRMRVGFYPFIGFDIRHNLGALITEDRIVFGMIPMIVAVQEAANSTLYYRSSLLRA